MSRASEAQSYYEAGLKRVKETPPPKGQKFLPGTFVWIAKDLGESMDHFEKDRPARVECTYAHAYGGDDIDSYSLLVRYDDGKWSSIAWYYPSQLTEITDPQEIKKYEVEIRARRKKSEL